MTDDDFAAVRGPITVELLPSPSWLIRRRNSENSITASYRWVATLSQTAPGECEVKGYLARQKGITTEEWLWIKDIAVSLGFQVGRYERYDDTGNFVAMVEVWRNGMIKRGAKQ